MSERRIVDHRPGTWAERLGPWNKNDARLAVLALMTVMSTLILINALTYHQPSRVARLISFGFPAYWVVFGPLIARFSPAYPGPVYTILPVLGCSILDVMDVLNRDATAAVQIFFVLMSLYAGSQLRPIGACIVTCGGIIHDGVVVFTVLPFAAALRDWCCAAIIFSTITFLLVRGTAAQNRLTEILSHQAAVDSLTGLVNRRVLEEAAVSAIVSAQGQDGTALILLDIDNFKQINDTYGHPVGDLTLAHIAGVILSNTRQDSVVSRLGGDELAILLPHCSYETARNRAAELVRTVHASPLRLAGSGAEIVLSVSAGVAHAPTHGDEMRNVYAAADSGLYRAKRQGRNQVGTTSALTEPTSAPAPAPAELPVPGNAPPHPR